MININVNDSSARLAVDDSSAQLAVNDSSAQLAVKDAIFARSGIYEYSHADVVSMGFKPKQAKSIYREYRPAGVLVAARDKFNAVPVTKDHPPVDVAEDNLHQYMTGVTGGPVEIVPMPDGEIGLRGKLAFYTKDAYDGYMSGNRETSAGYSKRYVVSDDPEKDGYDWVMTNIDEVNHIAVLPKGRGGKNVRVLDKAINAETNNGGNDMSREVKARKGFLSFLGIGKKDASFSKILLESVAKVHSLDAAGIETEVAAVMHHVNILGDSEAKEVLVGAVTDCFKNPVEVIAKKDVVAAKIDELYIKCQDADSAVVKRILDGSSDGDDKKDDKADDKKDADAKDAAPVKDLDKLIDAAVSKAVVSALDGISAKIDESVKKALGVDEKGKKSTSGESQEGETTAVDSAANEDSSWLTQGVFGSR